MFTISGWGITLFFISEGKRVWFTKMKSHTERQSLMYKESSKWTNNTEWVIRDISIFSTTEETSSDIKVLHLYQNKTLTHFTLFVGSWPSPSFPTLLIVWVFERSSFSHNRYSFTITVTNRRWTKSVWSPFPSTDLVEE